MTNGFFPSIDSKSISLWLKMNISGSVQCSGDTLSLAPVESGTAQVWTDSRNPISRYSARVFLLSPRITLQDGGISVYYIMSRRNDMVTCFALQEPERHSANNNLKTESVGYNFLSSNPRRSSVIIPIVRSAGSGVYAETVIGRNNKGSPGGCWHSDGKKHSLTITELAVVFFNQFRWIVL